MSKKIAVVSVFAVLAGILFAVKKCANTDNTDTQRFDLAPWLVQGFFGFRKLTQLFKIHRIYVVSIAKYKYISEVYNIFRVKTEKNNGISLKKKV